MHRSKETYSKAWYCHICESNYSPRTLISLHIKTKKHMSNLKFLNDPDCYFGAIDDIYIDYYNNNNGW